MLQLPEISSWRTGVDVEATERRVKWLREQLLDADQAIAAQQRIITAEGELEAYKLSIESLYDSQRQTENELAELMQLRDVEVLDFALAGKPYDTHRASAKPLAVFLEALQRLFERVGQAVSTTQITQSVQPHIRNLCQLQIAGIFPSSFGIRFTTTTSADMTGDSLTGTALEATFDLINAEHPIDQAARLGRRVMLSYRHLVTTLIKVEATPKVAWCTPSGDQREWTCSAYDLNVLANRLAGIQEQPEQVLTARGTLTGASLRRHKFEFNGDQGNITGTAPVELAPQITACFGKYCKITYTETCFIDEAADREKRSRTLIDIEPA